MYRYLDRPVAGLAPSSRFLLWAVRIAASAIAERRCLGAALGPGFARHGLDGALPHLAMAMAILARESLIPVELGAPGCCRVAEHEAVLLALFGAGPTDDSRVRETLALFVGDGATLTSLHRAMRGVTAELFAAGMAPAESDPDQEPSQ